MAKYLYVIDLDERGEFQAHIEDKEGNVKWQVKYPEYYEDEESGEMIEGSTLFDDGYMEDKNDTSGLEYYLRESGILEEGDEIVTNESQMIDTDEEEENELNERLEELSDEYNIPIEVLKDYFNDYDIDPYSRYPLDSYIGRYDSDEDYAEQMVNDGVISGDSLLYHAEIYDTDKRILASEEADSMTENASDEDILEATDMQDKYDEAEEDDEEDILDRAKETYQEMMYNEVYSQLDGDPIQYFKDLGYSDEDIVKLNFVRIDYQGLAEELMSDNTSYEHDGDVYIFRNYARGGVMARGGATSNVEYVLWGTKKGAQDWEEDVLTTSIGKEIKITPELKKIAEEKGYDRLRVAKIDLSSSLDFKKAIKKYLGGMMADGGNLHMLDTTAIELMHHSKELMEVLKNRPDVEAWVVAKSERAATDLSDIVHYLEGKERQMMARGGNVAKYEIYHETLAESLNEIEKYVDARGYTFTNDKYFPDVTVGGIGYGETKRFSRGVRKEGKKSDGKVLAQIYRMDNGKYELNMYFSYEDGGETTEGVDLFEDYENIPPNVQKVLDRYAEAFEDGDYRGLEKAHKALKKIGYTFEYYLDGAAYDLRKIGEKGKSEMADGGETDYAKGGNVPSIERRVAEVNAMIQDANEKGLEVVDEGQTWQAPMKYKPIKYTRGVLYISYEELDLYKYNKGYGLIWEKKNDKIGKNDINYSQNQALSDIARMYRKVLKRYDNYGYADGGEMARGGRTDKYWIQSATKNKGALREEGKREGLIKGEEKLSATDLKKLASKEGKIAKQARLARTLAKLRAKKKKSTKKAGQPSKTK